MRFSTGNLMPHLTVALLAACGIDIQEAKAAVRSQITLGSAARIIPTGSRGRKKTYFPADVEEAKCLAEEFTKDIRLRGALRINRPYVYWTLYLLAYEWLYAWMHEDGRRTVARWDEPPTLKEDRVTISRRDAKLARTMARARAYVRDRSWLAEYDGTREASVDRASVLASLLSLARDRHLASGGRPQKWTVSIAARHLKMPVKTLTAFAQRDERIRVLVPESADSYLSRVARWAITECRNEGLNLTPTEVVRKAKILAKPANYRLVSSLIGDCGSCLL